ncbi:MAG TPA: class I adenylate-forming enzyme family protein [Polyangiales bacterium]|jgi:acyl-CoA synthetase (AMP-forming)/AMP-acid ligase II|nr:class I adenylate-forming enzyme family protein [Polyangiales bacterium]
MSEPLYPPPIPDPERVALLALIKQEGSAYALRNQRIHGTELPVFAHGPRNLRELYAYGNLYAERVFLVYEDERYTHGETWLRAAAIATQLAERGVKPGDRVAIAMRNYPEFVFTFMAVTSLGAIAVGLNGWWTGPELQYGLHDSGASWALVDGERLLRLLPLRNELGGVKLACCRSREPLPAGVESLEQWQAGWRSATMPERDIDPDADADILYTSGSTGQPKGAVSTHRAVLSAVLSWEVTMVCGAYLFGDATVKQLVRDWLALGARAHDAPLTGLQQNTLLVNVPLFHVTGLNLMLLGSYREGRKLVLMHKWSAEKAIELIERERVTHLHGVPTMTWEMLQSKAFSPEKVASLVSVGGGGAARPAEHVRQMTSKLPATSAPSMGYGMTETSALGAGISGADYVARPTSSGRPIPPLMHIDIVDDDGKLVPVGETGEIRLRSAANMRGYWNKPAETQAVLRDGYVYTGDIGRIDHEGFLYITDRKKDIVIRGGENISCAEVEAALYEHPAVYEAAVFGRRDERLGESLAAVVVMRPERELSKADLIAHLSARLSAFKVPEHIELTREQLPRIASGKIDKHALRQRGA